MKSLLSRLFNFPSSIFRLLKRTCIRNSIEFAGSAPYPGMQQHCSLAPLLISFAVTLGDSLPVFYGKRKSFCARRVIDRLD